MAEENKGKEEIKEIVIKISEEKQDLRISGMGNIHPIYEALIALLRRQLKDDEIVGFIKDEESLRQALAEDYFLEYIQPDKRTELINAVKSGKSLREIVDQTALILSENKRIKDGKVLYRADSSNNSRYFLKSLSAANPHNIYVETYELKRIEEKAKKVRIISKIKYAAAAALTAFLLLKGSCAVKSWRDSGQFARVTNKSTNYLKSEVEKPIERGMTKNEMYNVLRTSFNNSWDEQIKSKNIYLQPKF